MKPDMDFPEIVVQRSPEKLLFCKILEIVPEKNPYCTKNEIFH